MTFKHIGSSEPKYLSATDILIGDMSDIIYEFLLFDRPIILLTNNWVKKTLPDIGIKTDLLGLSSAINRSLRNKNEYQSNREFWLKKVNSITNEKASKRYIDIIIQESGISNPVFVFNHGNNEVRKVNLSPLVEEVKKRNFRYYIIGNKNELKLEKSDNIVVVGAHVRDLPKDLPGYKVTITHGLNGVGVSNLDDVIKKGDPNIPCYPKINLRMAAGESCKLKIKLRAGKFPDRTCIGKTRIGGYPKGDQLLELNTIENKNIVYKELGLEKGLPIITYAPAGERTPSKPGGSLSKEVIDYLRKLGKNANYHILVKLKYSWTKLPTDTIISKYINDSDKEWIKIREELENG